MGGSPMQYARLTWLFITVSANLTHTTASPTDCDPHVCRTVQLDEPQLFIDDYLIENRFNENFLSASVPHVAHKPERSTKPIVTRDPDKPWEADGLGYLSVAYDSEAKLFRLYYQVVVRPEVKGKAGYPSVNYCVGYAESADGIRWSKPLFGLVPWGSIARTNIVLQGQNEAHAPHIQIAPPENAGSIRNIGSLPRSAFRDHRILMYCGDYPHFLSTSHDGIRFAERRQQVLPRRIDCHQTLLYDEERREFVTFLRNKMIFGGATGTPKKANHRMISRLSSPELWTMWSQMPTTVLLPDAGDADRFYAMPTFRYGGVYFGFLHHLRQVPMSVEVELVTSRDGFNWRRSASGQKLIPVGTDTEWDRGMVYAADRVIENGDEWWLYYSGHGDYHNEHHSWGSVGLLRFRKEGFVSVRADSEGRTSYLVTRPFRWPGGDLVINADTRGGQVAVRVTDVRRDPLGELSYENCVPFRGDATRHQMEWRSGAIHELKGQIVRLEFRFVRADLYGFVAARRDAAE